MTDITKQNITLIVVATVVFCIGFAVGMASRKK